MFWLGDLNYRITEEIADQEVFDMLERKDLETLRQVYSVFSLVVHGHDRHAAIRV